MPESKSKPLITILITTRNRPRDLDAVLESLHRQTWQPLEILVIDDASSEPVEPVVLRHFPDARVVRNPVNKGLIASRSDGFRMASGEFIAQLDDDSCFTGDRDLELAVARFEAEPDLGVLAFDVHIGSTPPPPPSQAPERYVHTFIGCAVMIRKELIAAIGGYCDRFFRQYEEIEFCMRAIGAGWAVVHFPRVLVHHWESRTGRDEGRAWSMAFRNSLTTIGLHMPWHRVPVEAGWKILSQFYTAFRRVGFGLYLRGLFEFLGQLAWIAAHRKPLGAVALSRYDAIRFTRILTRRQFDEARRPSIRETLAWFFHVRPRRRREKAFWHRWLRPAKSGPSR